MSGDLASRSWVLRVWPWLLLAEAATIAAVVMPAVLSDPGPGATPERAGPVFAVLAAIDVALAIVGAAVARWRTAARPLGPLLFGSAAVLVVQALAFTDAAAAYHGHGAAMWPAFVVLVVCVIVDLALAAALVAAALGARRRR